MCLDIYMFKKYIVSMFTKIKAVHGPVKYYGFLPSGGLSNARHHTQLGTIPYFTLTVGIV